MEEFCSSDYSTIEEIIVNFSKKFKALKSTVFSQQEFIKQIENEI